MHESDLLSLLFGSTLTVSSILFGLYGVFLVQYDQARASLSHRMPAYRVLLTGTGIMIGMGFCEAILVFSKLNGVAYSLPWSTYGAYTLPVILILFYVILVAPIAIIAIFGILYVTSQ
jgi:hypothetical protein